MKALKFSLAKDGFDILRRAAGVIGKLRLGTIKFAKGFKGEFVVNHLTVWTEQSYAITGVRDSLVQGIKNGSYMGTFLFLF